MGGTVRTFVVAVVVAVATIGMQGARAGAAPADCADHSDYDGNGLEDLAVGAHGQLVGAFAQAGTFHVIYSDADGLQATTPDDHVWDQGSEDVPGLPSEDDFFGYALASGDFNDDGFDDVAIGAYGDQTVEDGDVFAGSVTVMYGSSGGLQGTSPAAQFWTAASPGVKGAASTGDAFGSALAAADFDGDGFADLAIGALDRPVDGHDGAGVVHVLYGGGSGLQATSPDDELLTQDSLGTGARGSEGGDLFGAALAAGDFGRSARCDLAIGAPGESFSGEEGAGAVSVVYGTTGGFVGTQSQTWTQGSPHNFEAFGSSLAAGDFDEDGAADLAIGAPGDRVAEIKAGAVTVLYGNRQGGLGVAGNQRWSQASGGIAGAPERGDQFGAALATGDVAGGPGSPDDLIVGVPSEDRGANTGCGQVHVIKGTGSGLAATGSAVWHEASAGIPDAPEDSDAFGSALRPGHFSTRANDVLVVGAFGETVGAAEGAGAVFVIPATATGLTGTGSIMFTEGAGGLDDAAEGGDLFGFALS